MTGVMRDRTAIVGIAHSGASKGRSEPAGAWALRTCLDAIRDAGLEPKDIDGITTIGQLTPAGYYTPGTNYMIEALGLPGVRWYGTGLGGGVGPGTVADAAVAVAAGLCNYALAYVRMSVPRPGVTYNYMGAAGAEGTMAFTMPYGIGVFMQYFAPWYRRYRYEYGLTDEQMGHYVVTMRDNATRNEKAIFHQKPITLDDYLNAPMVCDPMRILDCDMPVDVCGAAVVTTAERARDLRQKPVYISAVSTGTGPRPDMIFWHDYTETAAKWAAKTIWEDSGFAPADMDFAMMYDGFAPLVIYGLEEFGLVKRGEAGPFLGSDAITRVGALPVNPHGGNNSEGRSWAIGHMVEATLQLRGQAGPRQLAKANACVVNGGAMMLNGGLVLHT